MNNPEQPVINLEAEGQALLQNVIGFYHATLKEAPEALAYLKARGIDHPEVIDRFKLGYANRTLGLTLPSKQLKAGAAIRGKLTQLGLYRDTGHEHFNGSLVMPIFDEAGNVVEVYGRKLLNHLRKGTPLHLYLSQAPQGVWNVEGIRNSTEAILCKSLIDALTFWCAGYRNVTATYGVDGFTDDHLEAFRKHGIQRVLIAYDPDEAGNAAAIRLAEALSGMDIECRQILFPKGMDANAYALKSTSASEALGQLIQQAEPIKGDMCSSAPRSLPSSLPTVEVPELFPAAPVPCVAKEPSFPDPEISYIPIVKMPLDEGNHSTQGSSSAPISLPEAPVPPSHLPKPSTPPEPNKAMPAPSKPAIPGDDLPHDIQGQDLRLTLDSRSYRIRGWQKPLNPETLKVNVMVSRFERFHVDSLDLYQAKARAAFAKQASLELGVSEGSLKLDLGKVLRKVETLQADLLAEALKAKDQRPTLTEAEHADALSLLQSPDLMTRILQDFDALGIVGEESNKLTGYLAAVSRLLDRPLALLIQSASAAGKSSLMDAVLDLLPEEALVRYSAMSGQSLFYMGERDLSHKVLAIAEEEGAKQASYALKLLQSEGRVTMASTGKNPTTGMLETHDYTVEGPVMLFLTTTAIDVYEELLNRCMVLTVDESREQTRAIHTRQRTRETLEGLVAKTHRDSLITLHRNAQRLLQPLAVVNPYADQLSFRDDQTRSRRDHVKYLTLIRSIALLHQFQREVKTVMHQGQEVAYIEVIPSDIALANELAQEVLGRSLDELLPQTRKLLELLQGWVKQSCDCHSVSQTDFRFTRKQVRDALGWGDTQLKVHLARLVEMELLLAHRGRQGSSYSYELLYQGEDADGRAKLLGLIDCTSLQVAPETALLQGQESTFAGHGRSLVGGQSEVGRGAVNPLEASKGLGLSPIQTLTGEKRTSGVSNPHPSYPPPPPAFLGEVLR